jgi:cytochrome P450
LFIPKGAVCILNAWLLNRDPEIYGEEAAHFNPARPLDANGDIALGPLDTNEEGHFSYGFGRRACIDRHVANNFHFIGIGIVLWAAKFEQKKDES